MMRKVLSFVLAILMVLSLVSVSAFAAAPLEITKQPTVADPSVEVNASSAEFQWYGSESKSYDLLTDADVRPIDFDSQYTNGVSSFDNTTGEWTPVVDEVYMEFFWIELNAGESITLYFSDAVYEPGLGNFETYNAFYGVENEDGSYTITVDESGEFVCMTMADAPVTVKAYGMVYTYEAIEGETDALLSKMTAGNKYYCEVTLGDEVVNSDIFTAAYQINKQPTVNDPSVVPSFAEDVDYYQWYKLVKGNVEITDKTEGVTTEAVYDSENGVWHPYVTYEGSGDDVMYVFDIDLYKGDAVTVSIYGGDVSQVYFGNNDSMRGENAELDENGNYVYNVTVDANYTLVIEAPSTDITVKAVVNTNVAEAIDGENERVLPKVIKNETYLCEVVYKDGTSVWSESFSSEFGFVKHPTMNDPSVELNFEDEIKSYQWYKLGDTATEGEIDAYRASSVSVSYVKEQSPLPEDIPSSIINERSYYDNEINAWVPASISLYFVVNHFGFLIDLEAGDTLVVESVGSIAFDSFELCDINDVDSDGYSSEVAEDGTLSATVEKTGTYILVIYEESSGIVSTPDETAVVDGIAFRAYGNVGSFLPVDGETDSDLSSLEYGKRYFCEATYNDDTVCISDTFKVLPYIISQPTSDAPFVEVAFKDHVVSYQWNLVETGTVNVTDENAEPADYTDNEQGTLAHYDPETNSWTPAYYGTTESYEMVVVENRIYYDNSDSQWANVYCFCFTPKTGESENTWPGNLMTRIEDTDIWYYDLVGDYEAIIFNNGSDTQTRDLFIEDGFGENNMYNVTTNAFSLYEEEVVLDIHEFDLFNVDLKAGQTLTITPSEELFYGYMTINGEYVYANENGDYVYTATTDESCYVYAQDDIDYDITFTATVSNIKIYTPVEDADKSAFIPEEAGNYVCYITYDDGYVLTTDTVELNPENFSSVEGDVNDDGKFNMFDYVLVKAIYFGKGDYTALDTYRADYNNDGKVNMFDYAAVKSLYFASK